VIIEAMLAELPVVATDIGSVSELVDDGSTGILVPPEDGEALAGAIGSLLADADRRRAMGRRGRQRALESFTVGAMAAGYEALYEEVVA
jgi:starch synthase